MANMASACALVVSEDKSFNPIKSWSTKTAATTCVLVSISVICTCTLVVCGVIIVREFSLAYSYKKTEDCWVKNITYSDMKTCQFCHKDKSKDKHIGVCTPSQFPCVKITVGYVSNGRVKEGLLHSDSIEASGQYSDCSHHVCMQSFQENKLAVEEFVEKWRNLGLKYLRDQLEEHNLIMANNVLNRIITNYFYNSSHFSNNNNSHANNNSTINDSKVSTINVSPSDAEELFNYKWLKENKHVNELDSSRFVCFYNYEEPFDVIEHKNYSASDVIHCMLWPSLIIAICCLLFLYVEAQRRNLTCCGVKQPNSPTTTTNKTHQESFKRNPSKSNSKKHYVLTNYSNPKKTHSLLMKNPSGHTSKGGSVHGDKAIKNPTS